MYQFTVPMAIMDFVPVAFFGVSAVVLLHKAGLKDWAGKQTAAV